MSIVLAGLTKNFGGVEIVSGVNLEIQDGELFVLLGGSGSGKSTILRMIAGLARPDAGTIHLHGRNVTHLPPQERNTGFVFQNYSIFKHMTIWQNIEFGLRVRRVPPAKRRERSEELMELVGLGGLGHRYASQLSGGQQQRVALARALAYEPAVLLLDEPFGALDVKIRAQLRRGLRDIQQKLKVTAILVTHDQEEGFELADRIGVLERGNLIEVGSPEGLYHRPSSQFAATFVGGGNLLVGSLKEGNICLGSRCLPIPESAPAHLEGAPARILIRPENLLLSREEQPTSLGQGRVVDRVFAGPVQRLRVEADELAGVRCISPPPVYGQAVPQLEAALPASADGQPLQPGERVWLSVRHYHLLERTGLRSLILADSTAGGQVAVEFGLRVAESTGAPATLLGIVGPRESETSLQQKLTVIQKSMLDRLPNLKVKVRSGPPQQEILREIRQGLHEMLVLGEDDGAAKVRMSPLTLALLRHTEVPVLLVQRSRPRLERILICTGAGEPGKADVWMGGRMAKRAGASATVVHVLGPDSDETHRQRSQRHLELAQASLHGMGVQAHQELLTGPGPGEVLLDKIEAGDFDMLVLGIPENFDMVNRLVRGTHRPVLFVPLTPG